MYSKRYHDYLKPLREREVRPPFARMADMVEAAHARRVAVPMFAKLVAAIALCGIFTGGFFWMQSRRDDVSVAGDASHRNLDQFALKSRRDGMLRPSTFRPSGPLLAETHFFPVTHVTGYQHTVPSGLNSEIDEHKTIPFRIFKLLHTVEVQPITMHFITGKSHPFPPIPIPDSGHREAPMSRLNVTIGDALSQQFSSDAAFRQFSYSDAFAGIGYNLSRNSSVRMLGGEEVFALNQNSYYTTYHDTTFFHNGVSYANIIGEVHTTSGASLTRVYWLGAGYRYTIGDASIRPFVEIMVGGSTDGLLTHQSLGAEFTLSQHFDFDILAQMSELLPQGSRWLTKAGVALELSYAF